MAASALRIALLPSIEEVDAGAWNLLAGDSPFLRFEFLAALERNGCVGARFGWHPCHIVARSEEGALQAALPLYLKTNSYGEFVFDWSWASAYEQAGMHYYPKLVSTIPYTPATGRRLLVAPGEQASSLRALLIEAALEFAQERNVSSLHWLFHDAVDAQALAGRGYARRMGCQYHWQNRDYRDFNDYLDTFISRKRKKVRREREHVQEQGITLRVLSGRDCDASTWRIIHRFYEDTFERKSGIPTLSLSFFEEVGRTMGEQIVLVLAEQSGEPVACATNFRSEDALYGRFWGCKDVYRSLHFEACYYQGIDYCIRAGLKRFEPGAQGEHKISRGFLPVPTWSAHWIADASFRGAVERFCRQEEQMMSKQCAQLALQSPFRAEGTECADSQPGGGQPQDPPVS